MKKWVGIGLSLLVLGLVLFGRGAILRDAPPPSPEEGAAPVSELPVVGDAEHLRTLLKNMLSSTGQGIGRSLPTLHATGALAASAFTSENAGAAVAKSAAADVTGYSDTNVQVAGVDEADRTKTDGEFLFRVNGQKLIIAALVPASEMKVIKTLNWEGTGFTPLEIYVDAKYLVVVGTAQETPASRMKAGVAAGAAAPYVSWPQVPGNVTQALVYDRTDLADLKQVRQAELQGQYLSSRKIGTSLYLATNQYIDYPRILSGQGEPTLPFYRDSAVKNGPITVDYSQVHYFPGAVEPNYFMVAGLNLDKPEQKLSVLTYLGSGRNIYASGENLYVAVTRIIPLESSQRLKGSAAASAAEDSAASGASVASAAVAPPAVNLRPNVSSPQVKTVVYKFALAEGLPEYQVQGEVPGRLLNQFSMDEYQGNFRLATTEGEGGFVGENTFRNQVYILDKDMKLLGKVEDIAPGERIYSVRFMRSRAYMVTFQMVDPFFVLDLQNPQSPKVLGELKIPGYSDYLQPYDENHILGFGKEATVQTVVQGGQKQERAYYLGMKVALFDVRDVAHPKELFKENIGDRGTNSEVLQNHKALLFDREKNLLAFPVSVFEVKGNTAMPNGVPAYGNLTFQGLYVYDLDLEQGFRLKGKITHMGADTFQGIGKYNYTGRRNIERTLYIGDTLYAISPSQVSAHNLETLNEVGRLELAGG